MSKTTNFQENLNYNLYIYIYNGRVYVCLYIISSLPNGSSDGKTEYTIKFVKVQGCFLG